MKRDIKFKAWNHIVNRMQKPFTLKELCEFENIQWQNLTFLQYTGLKDKDDIEIYEGDIVEIFDGLRVIKYNYNGFNMTNINGDDGDLSWYFKSKVVGNIFENKNLLEDHDKS